MQFYDNEPLHIAISGQSGCGATTLSNLLAKDTGCTVINYTFRQMAEEKGMTFQQLQEASESNFDIDRELDAKQVEKAKGENRAILASRLAIWNMGDADLKIYLDCPLEERSRRIAQRENKSFETALSETQERDHNNTERFKKIYGIDNTKFENQADIVLSSYENSPAELAKIIKDRLAEMEKLSVCRSSFQR